MEYIIVHNISIYCVLFKNEQKRMKICFGI